MTITSTEFSEGRPIPTRFSCDGADKSPPLAWADVPDRAESLALIMDDPDAPMGTYVHWVIYNMPATRSELPGAVPADRADGGLGDGTIQGTNDFQKTGYGGPCPPDGEHRYFFKLYALDTGIQEDALTKDQLLERMTGHIIEEAQLMGTFMR